MQHFERTGNTSIGEHKEKQSNVEQKENKKGWSKKRVIATLGAIVIASGLGLGLGYIANKNHNEHKAVEVAKEIVISKMENEGYTSKKDYKNANFDFDEEEAILVYIFNEILDWQEMNEFIQSSTYDNGMHHYLSLSQSLTANGFIEYDKTTHHASANYSHWTNYCINVITDAYNKGTLEDLITRLMLTSRAKNLEEENFDINYTFDLQGGKNR